MPDQATSHGWIRWPQLSPTWLFLGLVTCGGTGIFAYEVIYRASAPIRSTGQPTGTAIIDSRPPGATVIVDGSRRGITPLRLALPLGAHLLELRNGPEFRTLPLTIEKGTTVSQHVDLAPRAAEPMGGALEVSSDPAGAEVRIDGVAKGKTPLSLGQLQAGEHTVVIGKGATAVTRNIKVARGATTSVVVSPKPEVGVQAGWVTFKSPLELRVFEEGRLIGTTSAHRLMLAPGRHSFELTSDALEFRTQATVQVAAGQTATAAVQIPNGSLSINALPWAEVLVDGEAMGVTPLANLSLPIGAHEIVWRHPQLGERRQAVTVPAGTPARIGMDLTK